MQDFCPLETTMLRRLPLILLGVLVALWALALHGVNQWTRPNRMKPRGHPRDYNLPYEDVEFHSRDNITLRGWFISPKPCEGSVAAQTTLPSQGSPAVIFCHGHGGNKDPDLIYAPWFIERGIPVLLFDFRNHGQSDGDITSMGFYERFDLLGAIDYLVARGYTRLGLMGFSMGAAVAIATAPLSEYVECVVADSAFAELPPTLAMGMVDKGFPRWFAKRFVHMIIALGARRLRCDVREAYPVRAVRHFYDRPLLLILGGRDEYIEPWQGRWLYDEATGPKEFWFVPEAKHRLADKAEPELYRAKVMGFFEKWLMPEAQNTKKSDGL
jgi:fermentation-respiration switch protein FrsA (DUF1100 family)